MIVVVESYENQYVFNNLFFTFYPCVLLVIYVVKPKNLLKTQKQTKTKNQKTFYTFCNYYLLSCHALSLPESLLPTVQQTVRPFAVSLLFQISLTIPCNIKEKRLERFKGVCGEKMPLLYHRQRIWFWQARPFSGQPHPVLNWPGNPRTRPCTPGCKINHC